MKQEIISRRVFSAFFLVLCCTIGCLAFSSYLSVRTLQSVSASQRVHAESFVPAKRLTTAFEREILNARIFFIYFVTIQKPGSLPKGWERYHNAEDRLRQMSALIERYPELAGLRAPAAKLRADVVSYGEALAATLKMVQGGERNGSHYDAQVKEWAARGAVLVTDAGNLESLCFHSSELNTNETIREVTEGQASAARMRVLSLLVCLAMALYFVRSVRSALAAPESSASHGELAIRPV